MGSPRYAIYWAPEPQTALAGFASGVLGLDGRRLRPAVLSAAEWTAIIEAPAHDGFHGTLKAPFHLAEGQTEEALRGALETFAASRAPVALPDLSIAPIGPFIAFHASGNDGPLSPFAFEIVRHFEPFRAALSPHDKARRKPDCLSPSQRENLMRYGYPYVDADFRFHLTLTGSIADDGLRARIAAWLADMSEEADVTIPARMESLSLFSQPDRESRFTEIARYPLEGAET